MTVRNKRCEDVVFGDEILIQSGEVGTVMREPVVLRSGQVFVSTDRGILTGSLGDPVRVVAEGWSE